MGPLPSRTPRIPSLAVLIVLLVLAALLRVHGLGWKLHEEATPLHKAWGLWGWGPDRAFDPNPHFFDYPSLTIYLQFLVQGLLYLGLRISGGIHSTLDFRTRYFLDKSLFLIAGRYISVLFGTATVWVTYRLGRRAGGGIAAAVSGFLLAVSAYHIARSQMVEVDVPVTFFLVLSLWFTLRLAEKPDVRTYLLAGTSLGLAVSSKYTAALFVIPLLAAHLLAGDGPRKERLSRRALIPLGLAVGTAVIVFVATSPFVILDAATAWQHIGTERAHMRAGHFGLGGTPTWLFYLRALGERVAGWPALAAAAAGLVLAIRRRRTWALIMAAFLVPYLAVLCSWSMHADRYLLPVLPVILILAGACLEAAVSWVGTRLSPRLLPALAAAGTVMLAIQPAAALSREWTRPSPDTRGQAKAWVTAELPPGSLIVTELTGPSFLSPASIWTVDRDLREHLMRLGIEKKMYAELLIPMFQVHPEQSAAFYDLALYRDADVIITSSTVRSRYEKEPHRFPRQMAFYESLDARFRKAATFRSPDGDGPTLVLYQPSRPEPPFLRRSTLHPPPPLRDVTTWTGREAPFYQTMGLNYETYHRYAPAVTCYEEGLACPLPEGIFPQLVLGKTRCLLKLGQGAAALRFLSQAESDAHNPSEQAYLRNLRRIVQSGGGGR